MNRLLFAAVLAASLGLGCQRRQAAETAPRTTIASEEASARKKKEASEFTRVRFEVPLARTRWQKDFADILKDPSRTGTLELGRHAALQVAADPATGSQRVMTLIVRPTDPARVGPFAFARVPIGTSYPDIFFESAQQALATVEVPTPLDILLAKSGLAEVKTLPWEVGYESKSPSGGRIALSLRFADGGVNLVVEAETPEQLLTEKEFLSPAEKGPAVETVFYDIPMVDAPHPFSGGFWDILRDGDVNKASMLNFVKNPTHAWYDMRIGVLAPNRLAQVTVDLRTRDGRSIPLIKAPGSFQGTFAWLTALDSFINAEEAESIPFRMDYYYSDPDKTGTAYVTAKTLGGKVRMYHISRLTPNELQDVEPKAWAFAFDSQYPITSKETDPTLNKCTAERCAEVGITFRADASLSARFAKPLDIVGVFTRVTRNVPLPEVTQFLRFNAAMKFAKADLSGGKSAAFDLAERLQPGPYRAVFFADVSGDGWFQQGEPYARNLLSKELPAGKSRLDFQFDME